MTQTAQHTELPEFLKRFEDKYVAIPFSGCWIWMATGSRGYGSIAVNRIHQRAHRISYELHKGVIPAGFDVDHLCGVKSCVNPYHLEAVSHKTNCQRRDAHRTTCAKGHDWSGKNSRGEKICHTCQKDAAKRYRAAVAKAGAE